MKDKTILRLITAISISGWFFLFRKGSIKDWFLIYLFKIMLTTLLDGPIAKKKLVKYPYRFLEKLFSTNIIFDYVLFPVLCVLYSQLTLKMKRMQIIVSAFIFSAPMTYVHNWLEKNTRLVKYGKGWNWVHTLTVFTMTFWCSRVFIAWIRVLDQKRTAPQTAND